MGWDCKLYIIYPSFHSGPAKAVVRKAHRTHSNVGSLLTLFRHKKSPIRGCFNGGGGGIRTHVRRLSLNTLSRRAPSTTRPPIHIYYRRCFVVSAPRRAPCKIKDFIPCGTVLADISRGPPVGRHHSPTTRPPIQFFIVYTFILNKMQEKNKCSFKKFADKGIFSLVGIIYFFSCDHFHKHQDLLDCGGCWIGPLPLDRLL